jgi:phosphohistidine phosphatase
LALARLEVPIELCLSSPKLRALKTAELACEELGVEVALTGELAGEPFDPQSVAAGLQDALLVGHEPSISSAVRELTGANVAIRKGGLAGIDGRELVVLMTPDQLLAMASVQGVA